MYKRKQEVRTINKKKQYFYQNVQHMLLKIPISKPKLKWIFKIENKWYNKQVFVSR